MRIQRRYAYLATFASALLVLSACSNQINIGKALCRNIGNLTATVESPPAATGTSDLKIGLVTDVGTIDDKNFNQFSWEGAEAGAASIGAPAPQSIVTTDSADYAANIQSFVDDEYDVIITVGFALGAATLVAATDNPDVHFVGVDQFQDPAAAVGNYESLIFNEAQAGYLAGMVAGSITASDEIAAIGGAGFIPPVVNYMRGFENGALSVNPAVTVHLSYVSDDLTVAFNDPIAGKSFADAFLAVNTNVDVLFQVAGKTGNGVLQSAEAAGIYAIGVDVDQWYSTPESAECIVTSAEKHLKFAVRDAIETFASGNARDSNVFYGADNDGIGLAPYYQFADLISSDLQADIDAAYAGMADLTVDPCSPNRGWDSGNPDSNCFNGNPDAGN